MENNNQDVDMWRHDLLKRREVANYLSNYLQTRYKQKPDEDGFVLAINAEWGFGKTFLMEAWVKELQYQGFAAVYFDAWKNDFTPEPLVAFISNTDSELTEAFKEVPAAQQGLKDAIETLGRFVKPALNVVAAIALKRFLNMGTEELVSYFQGVESKHEYSEKAVEKDQDALLKGLSHSLSDALKEHKNKNQAISAFREKLSILINALTKSSKFQLPVFFFVDELDRCRPDYAIELLEGIKHLFGVPGIYFVIGLNSLQLSESTKAVYGSGFDGARYLKRFFDQEYLLPEPDHESFTDALFKSAVIPDDKNYITELQTEFYPHDSKEVVFEIYAKAFSLGLRDRRRTMRIIEAALSSIQAAEIHVQFLFFLAILYERDASTFEQLISGKITAQDVSKLLIDPHANIRFRRRRSDMNSHDATSIHISKVAEIYLQTYKKSLGELSRIDVDENFPGSVVFYLQRERPPQGKSSQGVRSSVAEYPNLIRHAGHFF